jgi:hypothetical protein
MESNSEQIGPSYMEMQYYIIVHHDQTLALRIALTSVAACHSCGLAILRFIGNVKSARPINQSKLSTVLNKPRVAEQWRPTIGYIHYINQQRQMIDDLSILHLWFKHFELRG